MQLGSRPSWLHIFFMNPGLYEPGPEILVHMHRHWGLAACEPDKHVPSLAAPFDDLDPGLAELADQFLALHQVHARTLVSSGQSDHVMRPLLRKAVGATI